MPLLGELTYALIGATPRFVGGIIPDVTISEDHRDGLLITQHPVEKGTAVTDHAFTKPCEVDMRLGFSNSSAGDPGYARAIYAMFLAWRESRDPRDVYTGKRAYSNMLPAEIGVHTDKQTENILALDVRLQQLTITSTQTGGRGTGTTDGDTTRPAESPADQSNPASTASIADKGPQQATDVGPQSLTGASSPNFAPGMVSGASILTPDPLTTGLPDGVSPSVPLATFVPPQPLQQITLPDEKYPLFNPL